MSNVSPGYTFTGAADPLTYQKLNLLSVPTVTIGAGEVTVSMLAGVVGGGFLGRTASSSGAVSFVQLNNGNITWPTVGLAICGSQPTFLLGEGNVSRYSLSYDTVTTTTEFGGSGLSSTSGTAKFYSGLMQWYGKSVTNTNYLSFALVPQNDGSGGTLTDILMGNVSAALSTSATAGFTYFKTCAGSPSGAADSWGTTAAAMVVDSTNHRVYFRYNGAWKYAALT